MPEISQSDSVLMTALQAGDESALLTLIARWERPLFSFAYRYSQNPQTARDIVEETVVRLFTKRAYYNPKRPLSTWIFSIAANLCRNHSRWTKRHPTRPWSSCQTEHENAIPLEEKLACSSPTPIEENERSERNTLLRSAIDQLPHNLKTTLLLYYYEGLSYQEISDVSECSIRGVETRLYRARKLLKRSCASLIESH